MSKTEAELYQQFEELIADLKNLNNDPLQTKNPQRAKHVKQQITYLQITVRQNPAAAKAVIYTAGVMWHLLQDDARSGARQRGVHLRLGGEKLPHEKATPEELKAAIDDYYQRHPDGKITDARKQVAADVPYSDPHGEGARTVAKRTGRHNPYKNNLK